MADPRIEMGYDVEPTVTGPFEVVRAKRDGMGNDGGTLDVGLVGRTASGERIIIGEVWAACPGERGSKVRIDAHAVAEKIVAALNAQEKA